MLFFAVRRRSAVDEATGPRNPIGKKGAGGALVAKASSSVLLFHRLRRFGLGSYTYRQHGKRSAVTQPSLGSNEVLATHRSIIQSQSGGPLDQCGDEMSAAVRQSYLYQIHYLLKAEAA